MKSPIKQIRDAARELARGVAAEFIGPCGYHGDTLFDTETGACLTCLATPSELPPRVRYMSAAATLYPATCPTHGDTLFHVGVNKCSLCSTAEGGPRIRKTPSAARVAARHAGATSYVDRCATHGDAPHHTVRGKCLRCFNTLGYPRRAAAQP